jgi:methylglyoxal synthase
MENTIIKLSEKKRIALVAHDNKKQDLLEWARWNKTLLIAHDLYATGTTGNLLEEVLGTTVHKFQSGPLGGDQQIGAKIAEGVIDFMIFFWDPLSPQPHDTDVKALLRIAVVWNIPIACNRASADFMISSTLMTGEYDRLVVNYQPYRERQVEALVAEKMDELEDDSTSDATTYGDLSNDAVDVDHLSGMLGDDNPTHE